MSNYNFCGCQSALPCACGNISANVVRLQKIGWRSFYKNSFKNSEKVWVVYGYFKLCFSLSDSRCIVRCDNRCKTGADKGNILRQPKLFECMGICILSLAHESEIRGYLVYVLIVKYLSHQFCLNSATVY